MRLPAFLALAFLTAPASAEIVSQYTTLDMQRDCSAIARPGPNEESQDWSRSLCNGWGSYPVYVDYGDARESLYFGFLPPSDLAMPFHSFAGFNSAGTRIEWRIEKSQTQERPFATILRWHVTADPETNAMKEVLVVSRVGQMELPPEKPQACIVGYVLASGDAQANDKARHIADSRARNFTCFKDKPSMIGDVPQVMAPQPE